MAPADDASGEDEPDADFGGNDSGSDNYGSVDNDDPINPDEEGDDQPDPDYGGNDPDSDHNEVEPGDIDPTGEGDDQPDPDFGGMGDDNFGGDEGDTGFIEVPTGVESMPTLLVNASASRMAVDADQVCVIQLAVEDPNQDPESETPIRHYMVKWQNTESGIQNVTIQALENDVIYNLYGVKVGADYKGYVIKNGKKYLQK